MWAAIAAVAQTAIQSDQKKGGAASAPVSSGSGFNNQTFNMGWAGGLPDWNMFNGGSGTPPQAHAFQTRPDSLVMGMTGLSTTNAGKAVGNGTAVNQPAAVVNSLVQNPWMWGAVAVVGIAFIWGNR